MGWIVTEDIDNSRSGCAPLARSLSTDLSTVMKIRPEQLDRLAAALLERYQGKDLILAKASEASIKSKIAAIISANFAEEEAIENEVRQMLANHAAASRDMDPYKMFLIAKQKLAAKKGFIL
jgi:hypothetical protein